MPRTIVDIPASQLTEIDSYCRRLGISRAEAVRRALEAYLERGADLRADGFGLWTDHRVGDDDTAPATPARRRKAR